MKMPRLQQPLFSKEHGELYNKVLEDKLMARLVMAYDCIWSMLYEPGDMTNKQLWDNAEANLQNLGSIIEHVLGEGVFDVDPKQLSFPDEVLNPMILDNNKLG